MNDIHMLKGLSMCEDEELSRVQAALILKL